MADNKWILSGEKIMDKVIRDPDHDYCVDCVSEELEETLNEIVKQNEENKEKEENKENEENAENNANIAIWGYEILEKNSSFRFVFEE